MTTRDCQTTEVSSDSVTFLASKAQRATGRGAWSSNVQLHTARTSAKRAAKKRVCRATLVQINCRREWECQPLRNRHIIPATAGERRTPEKQQHLNLRKGATDQSQNRKPKPSNITSQCMHSVHRPEEPQSGAEQYIDTTIPE